MLCTCPFGSYRFTLILTSQLAPAILVPNRRRPDRRHDHHIRREYPTGRRDVVVTHKNGQRSRS